MCVRSDSRARSLVHPLLLALLVEGCGVAAAPKDAAAPPMPGPQEPATEAAAANESLNEAEPAAAPAPAPPAPPARNAGAEPGAAQSATSPTTPAEAKLMLDIEARLSIEVTDVKQAASELRKLARQGAGQITAESITGHEGEMRAELTLRVPARSADDLFAALEALGAVRNRQMTAKDIGKEFYDATIRLANLEAVRQRYEQFLAQAKTMEEVLKVQAELDRLSKQIEELKGNIVWMRDRAARATVYVSLYTHGAAQPAAILEPQAKLYPGVRLGVVHDFRGREGSTSYLGAGLELGATPQFGVELIGLKDPKSDTRGLDGVFVVLNGRVYSEFFGNGTRPFANPYLGLAGGYAHLGGKNEALLGAGVGLEILKGRRYVVDAEIRSSTLFGSKAGFYATVEPTVGATIAY